MPPERNADSVEISSFVPLEDASSSDTIIQGHGKTIDRDAKKRIRERFDRLAQVRERWKRKNWYYYARQEAYFRFLISQGLRVLELGCGTGDLLAAVKPSRGLGIDISAKMVEIAQSRYPHLEFRVGDLEDLDLREKFDAVILADAVGHLQDLEETFRNLRAVCGPKTRIIISYYNFLWEPILKLGEKIGWKMPQHQQNWLSTEDIANLLFLADFEVIKIDHQFLLSKPAPFVAPIVNKFLAPLPILSRACLSNYIVARMLEERKPGKIYSTTIIIPCLNERGNVENCIRRLPRFGGHQEIIFVDGRSTDGTLEEIQRVMREYPDRDIKLLVQAGKGKGDAVHRGFKEATGDILMILDADLTVPPEDLPKFYRVLATGKAEFANGCRLVYPVEDEAMRFLNLLGNKFFSMAFTWLLNQRFKDTLCGTKVMFRADYERLEANRDYFGNFDPFGDFDLIFGAAKLNLRVVEVPIRYRRRTYGVTNISRFRHGWLLLKMTLFALRKLKVH